MHGGRCNAGTEVRQSRSPSTLHRTVSGRPPAVCAATSLRVSPCSPPANVRLLRTPSPSVLRRNRGGKSGGQFLPQRTQSGGLFSHKRTEPVFLLRGRRLSDARTKCCLSTHPWILALRLRDGARARALAESRRIPEAMRGVESVMACGLILLLQSSARSCERRATSLPWLLSC
jgi:hypothetical protein